MTIKCLIDGDIIIYQASAVSQSVVYDVVCSGEVSETCNTKKEAELAVATQLSGMAPSTDLSIQRRITATAPVDTSIMAARAIVKNIKNTVDTLTQDMGGVSSHEIFLSGSDNFRIKAAKSKVYKGNRDPLARPLYYKEVKEYLSTVSTVVSGIEADDALGTAQFSAPKGATTCICTIDKDLRMIPGLHYNWSGDRSSIASVTTEEANRFFFTQLITGDSTDNIPGLFYFTKRKATKDILADLYLYSTPEDMYNYVRGLYSKTPDLDVDSILLEIGDLLWIRRREGESFVEHFGFCE